MKIESVEAIPVSYPEPNDFNALRHLCLCKITADDGQVGWGESITQFPEANFAVKAIIEGMAPNLIGRDPVHVEALWRQNKDQAWWYGYGGGISSYAVAAIDIALWDLRGKAVGASVLDLLGGPVHERLPAIASCHAHYEEIPAMVEEAQEWLSTGMQGVKVGFGKRGNARLGYEHDRDVEYVRQMREGIGEDKMLMIDCGIAIKWDVSTAVRRAQAMEPYNLTWIEEPLGAWDPEGYRTLRDKTSTLIAYGEKEWTLEGFERVLSTGTVDVVGVDPGRAEGITGFKKACDRIEAYRRQANAHAWSSAIVTAASLAISFSSPACKLFEVKPLRNPMQHELVTDPFEHVDGWWYPPTGVGLGIEVLDEVVDRYRSEVVLGV
ncbi:MAG: mandelate racemase/muconate lactonizing enzyme family protein [Actinobacteria bacterium]|nr:mandelate racemase/muconate lactonizing enzyme family protein [Actinomycetota bacterium]